MTADKLERLRAKTVSVLSEAMVARGCELFEPPATWVVDDSWTRSLWFVLPAAGGITPARPMVVAYVGKHRVRGPALNLAINGFAVIAADIVAEMRRGMPLAAHLEGDTPGDEYFQNIDTAEFGLLRDRPSSSFPGFVVKTDSSTDIWHAVGEFVELACGPQVTEWFGDRDSVAKLLELARLPLDSTPWDQENPGADRLRGVVLLSVVTGHYADAAALMSWYLERKTYRMRDSFERASAFDMALSERFPEYSAHRGK
ncbi:hypothetical protein OHB26_16355 [Nocardia sp. NBC_01503]|uniref:hypothetical protein n=1 Tax=Nocardia sp. NBC_01503 TaxID=2975997 RepID=UPI002E7C4A26|nr:hypothetical protein [Nocardia sp. NBC_01503]WTL35623.1 hypothetical protein OHB26_16355 [Nocardia sp. NBC_01503]